MKAKRHLVTINQLSDWPAVIYGSSDELPVVCLRSFSLDNSLLKRIIAAFYKKLSKNNIITYLLDETARCGIIETSLRYVAIEYCMHDSDGVLFGTLRLVCLPSSSTLKSGGGTKFLSPLKMQYVKQSNIITNLIIMY